MCLSVFVCISGNAKLCEASGYVRKIAKIKDKIDDLTFVSALEYLIKIGIIKIE